MNEVSGCHNLSSQLVSGVCESWINDFAVANVSSKNRASNPDPSAGTSNRHLLAVNFSFASIFKWEQVMPGTAAKILLSEVQMEISGTRKNEAEQLKRPDENLKPGLVQEQ